MYLENTNAICSILNRMYSNFSKLYRRKANLHHYIDVEGMEKCDFIESLEELKCIINDYEKYAK